MGRSLMSTDPRLSAVTVTGSNTVELAYWAKDRVEELAAAPVIAKASKRLSTDQPLSKTKDVCLPNMVAFLAFS